MSRRAFVSQADNDRSAPLRPFVCEVQAAWWPRALVAAALTVAAWVWVLWAQPAGGIAFASAVTAAMVAFGAWSVLQNRAWLEVTDDFRLRTRRFHNFHVLDGDDVRRVEEVMTGRSPNIRLVTDDGAVVVPASRLRAGHRILFVWLAACAPRASYDERAARIRQRLADDGWPVGLER